MGVFPTENPAETIVNSIAFQDLKPRRFPQRCLELRRGIPGPNKSVPETPFEGRILK
jgi:hypothetical protein